MGGVLTATAERIGNPLEGLDTRVFKRVSKSAIALFGFSECPKVTPIWVDFWVFSEKSTPLTGRSKYDIRAGVRPLLNLRDVRKQA